MIATRFAKSGILILAKANSLGNLAIDGPKVLALKLSVTLSLLLPDGGVTRRISVLAACWVDAVELYRRDGRSGAVVTRGFCEACFARIVEPVQRAMGKT
jgi:hypothetical protein